MTQGIRLLSRAAASTSGCWRSSLRCLHCHADGLATDTQTCPHCGVYLPPIFRDVLPSGTILDGKYRIEYPLGRGGFGITYRASHTMLERTVAIKEFFPQ